MICHACIINKNSGECGKTHCRGLAEVRGNEVKIVQYCWRPVSSFVVGHESIKYARSFMHHDCMYMRSKERPGESSNYQRWIRWIRVCPSTTHSLTHSLDEPIQWICRNHPFEKLSNRKHSHSALCVNDSSLQCLFVRAHSLLILFANTLVIDWFSHTIQRASSRRVRHLVQFKNENRSLQSFPMN